MTAIALQSLPLGFRFHPTDEELVNHYLKPKITGRSKSEVEVIAEIDVCKCEPWDLPDKSIIRSDDPEWFFFAPKDRKYLNGHRSNRATEKGYWKATGRDRIIRSKPSAGRSTIIGKKKTLVFHRGRAPKGERTNWIMHEYRTTELEFESGDQGGYVLYRLFRKSEEKSSCSNPDEMEPNGFSPTPTKFSPYDNHEADAMDEMETLLNHDSPSSDLQEEPKSSTDSAQKQPVDSKRCLDGDDYSTNLHVKKEKKNSILIALGEETRVKEKADPLQDILALLEPNYEQIDAPLLPCDGDYLTGNVNRDSQIGSYQVDNCGGDALDAFLLSALKADDCSATVFLKEPFRNFSKDTSWDSASCKDSGSCSDIDTELVLPQGADLETIDCFDGLRLPTDSFPIDSSVVYPELTTQLSTLYENATLLPYDINGPDVYSVDSGADSLQDLFNSMEESSNQKMASDNRNSCEETGIKLRSRQVQQERPNSYFQQGTAARRMRLERSIGKAPPGSVDHGFTGRDDNGNKESTEDLQPDLFSCMDRSTSENTTMRNIDEPLETGIKIRRQKLLRSPDEPFTQRDKTFTNFCTFVETQCAYSHSESGIIDNPDSKTETTEAAEHVGDHISQVWDSAPRTVLDKHEGLPIHDADQSPSSSNNYQMFRSILRFRRKSANDNMLKHSPYPTARGGHSIANYTIYLVSSVVLLLLCVGIWRCMSSGSV